MAKVLHGFGYTTLSLRNVLNLCIISTTAMGQWLWTLPVNAFELNCVLSLTRSNRKMGSDFFESQFVAASIYKITILFFCAPSSADFFKVTVPMLREKNEQLKNQSEHLTVACAFICAKTWIKVHSWYFHVSNCPVSHSILLTANAKWFHLMLNVQSSRNVRIEM